MLGSVVLAALAVGLRRPDLLVLAAPLLIATVAGRRSKPVGTPAVHQRLGHSTLTEGEATTYHIRVDDPNEQTETIAAVLKPQRWIDLRPEDGQVATRVQGDVNTHTLDVVVRPTRWGNYTVGLALVVATSSWGAYRWRAATDGATHRLQVLPLSSGHDASNGSLVAAPGLVGSHRSPRYGSGAEFATIRPFVAGDRLHRIRWAQSLRTGTLQVASTWADQDRHVVLVVDAVVDIGISTGIDGAASSLDITVRAAAAIAEHHISQGDRVSLVTVGSLRRDRLPPATGVRHLRRVLATLAAIQPAGVLIGPDRIPKHLGRGSLVIILSSLRSPWALTRAVAMSGQGLFAVVVDCLPPDLEHRHGLDGYEAAAWRIDRLRREHHLRRAGEMGIAVVPWRDPTSLDAVVRDLQRRRHMRSGWSA